MKFSECFVGQNKIKNVIQNSVASKKIGHAYLLAGETGMGKNTISEAIARVLLCEHEGYNNSPETVGFCDDCQVCKLVKGGANPDYKRLSGKDGKPPNVEEIRENLVKEAMLKPVYSDRKVFIVEKADKLNKESQNCLLKTLEEPPSYVTIILLAANPKALFKTLRSRIITLNLDDYSKDELYRIAVDNGIDSEMARSVANGCAGNPGKALQLAANEAYIELRNDTINRCLKLSGRVKDTYEFMHFVEANKDDVKTILEIMQTVYRDLMVAASGGRELINTDYADKIVRSCLRAEVHLYVKCIEIIQKKRVLLERNINFGIGMQDMFMRIQEENDRWLK